MFENVDLIHVYTRADALRDGVLIDVSATAREAGIRWPVALSRAVWERCVRVPLGVLCQDEAGRLWDVLWMLRWAVARQNGGRRGVRAARPQRQPRPHAAAGAAQGRVRLR
jgi:hypothetical protein